MNKQAIIDAVFQGAGKVAKNRCRRPSVHNDAVVDDPYDPEKCAEDVGGGWGQRTEGEGLGRCR